MNNKTTFDSSPRAAARRMKEHLAITGVDYSASPYFVPGSGLDYDLERRDAWILRDAYIDLMEKLAAGFMLIYTNPPPDDRSEKRSYGVDIRFQSLQDAQALHAALAGLPTE